MRAVVLLLLLFVYCFGADVSVEPVSKTKFIIKDQNGTQLKSVDLLGRDFIVVSVREKGSDGRFYAVDKDGTVWLSEKISSGGDDFKSPSGIFEILEKRRYHMSKSYPDPNGINNMDYMMRFTKYGHALHKKTTVGSANINN